MSETEKSENRVSDTLEVSCEITAKNETVGSNQQAALNESQDFCLVDSGEDDSADKVESNLQETGESKEISSTPPVLDAADKKSPHTVQTTASNEDTKTNLGKDPFVEDESAQISEPTESTQEVKKSDETCNLEDKEKNSDDEDIIQCTPPESSSPLKKQIFGNADTPTLKRKAESFDEPPSKILRTLSGDDALSVEKKKMEEDKDNEMLTVEDSQIDFTKKDSETNVIIAETQDPADVELTKIDEEEIVKNDDPILDDQELEAAMSEIHRDESDNLDKNKNINDSLKSDEAITLKEQTEKSPVDENLPLIANDNFPTPEVKENEDATKVTTMEANKTTEEKSLEKDAQQENQDQSSSVDNQNHIAHSEDSDSVKKSKDKEAVSSLNEQPKETDSPTKCSFKPRMSLEIIYDRTTSAQPTKAKKELVEIDEDGEKIVLDSSQEDSDSKMANRSNLDNTKAETIYKSCYESKSSNDFSYKSLGTTTESSLDSKSDGKLVNGCSETQTDSTASMQSDMFSDMHAEKGDAEMPARTHHTNKDIKNLASVSKDSDNADLLSVSDNDPDIFVVDENSKSKSDITHSSSVTKSLQIEREIGVYIKVKCLLNIDESTKEFVSKEVAAVHCEPTGELPSTRQKNIDTSASLADISDNKDGSPGSVNSNQQMFQLNPSRLSFASTISSLSSVSSAASLAAKLAIRDNTHFSLPRGPAKHAKKHPQDVLSSIDKQAIDETYERLNKEWQNSRLLTTTVLNFINAELNSTDTHNISNERLDDQLQKIRSSTPEMQKERLHTATPKSSKKGKAVKRPRSKNPKPDTQSNGLTKVSPKILIPMESNTTPSRKKAKTEHGNSTGLSSNVDTTSKRLSQDVDEMIGKQVFAKWSDNNYYPGMVIDKMKTKYKVNFYDGKNKVLIEDFIIPIPETLNEGLSVYATTNADDYGSCGIIVDVETTNDEIYYVVETDEEERIKVQVKDIFLSSDQAQVLKEELSSNNKSLPSTPKHMGQVSLDNMVEGKRRSKRIATPVFSTPKSKTGVNTPIPKIAVEPSVSGLASKLKKEAKSAAETDGVSSDSNVSVKEEKETLLMGVQPEIIGTPNEQIVKGPQNRMKSKSRSKKKTDDKETIELLGPIPSGNSTLFKGMSFILTCASVETIERYQDDGKASESEVETEDEEAWVKKPFVRERLRTQILAAGGKIYDEFDQIPKDEYKNTKLITNVPNTTSKSLLCLSVGIPAYNHNWIIRCCQEEKIVNPSEYELPVGWSLDKRTYIEKFRRPNDKPLAQVVVIIPVAETKKQFASFWRKICENAGAVVLLAENAESMEGFAEGVVLTNSRCPTWAIEKANELQIQLLSTIWVVQCLIEGKLCPYGSNLRYKYNYKQN